MRLVYSVCTIISEPFSELLTVYYNDIYKIKNEIIGCLTVWTCVLNCMFALLNLLDRSVVSIHDPLPALQTGYILALGGQTLDTLCCHGEL